MKIYLNKFCVYTHSIDGIIFYVGKGRSYRPFETSRRNNKWTDFVEIHGQFEVDILSWHETNNLALKEEARLIRELQPSCNNLMTIGYCSTEYQKETASKSNKGKTVSTETKSKIGNKIKGGIPHNKGLVTPHSVIEKLRLSQSKKSKQIIRDDGVIFNSIKGAAKDLNIPASTLRSHLSGKLIHACGMKFSYV